MIPAVDTASALIAVAATLTGIVVAFLWQPPFTAGPSGTLPSLGRFLVAIIVGVLAYPILRYVDRRSTPYWAAAAIASACLGVVALFYYTDLNSAWVRTYPARTGDVRYVVGDHLTPQAAAVRARDMKGNSTLDEFLLSEFPDTFPLNVYRVWDRREIANHEVVLAALYLAVLTTLSVAILSAGQCYRSAAP